jgi:molybdenum cofactor synthesis domain-containing protein
MSVRIGVLTVSDRGARGEYEDRSGSLIVETIKRLTPWAVTEYAIIADEKEAITTTLISWCEAGLNVILTTGGTGFAPRDVTPEATRQVVEREAPGIAEALRAESLKVTPHAMLSRGMAGMRGQTLIVNLPGSPKAVRENLQVLLPVLPHAVELLTGVPSSEQSHRAL